MKFSQKVILTCKKVPICPFLTAKTSKLNIIFRGYHSTFIHAWRRRARETAWMTLKELSDDEHACKEIVSLFSVRYIINRKKGVLYCSTPLAPAPPPNPFTFSIQNIYKVEFRIQNPESRVQSPESRVQSPEVQSPESRVQSPESRVQSPESRVQCPVLVLGYAVWTGY